jgi:hypothetical protein
MNTGELGAFGACSDRVTGSIMSDLLLALPRT